MTSVLNRYLQKKGHLLRARLRVGKKDSIVASITDSYIILEVKSPKRVTQTIYIPRSKAITLLKWLIPRMKLMEGPDFYVPDAVQEYLRAEDKLLRGLKAQREASRPGKRRRSRRR